MRCRSCDYALWNLPAGRCPECGDPFKPSDFDFIVGQVRFLCPHCRQAYYGDDKRGQLRPRAFNCVRCGQAVHIDDTLLLPAEGVGEYESQTSQLAWEQRREIGSLPALVSTLRDVILRPRSFGRRINNYARSESAVVFSLLMIMLSSTLGAIVQFAAFSIVTEGQFVVDPDLIVIAAMGGVLGLWYFTGLTIWGLAVALLTRWAAPESVNSAARATACMWYAQGAMLLMVVPIAGVVLAPLCVILSSISMVASSCRVSPLHAALAVLLPAIPIGVVLGLMIVGV
jgi:hypothetical protein